jgi:tape measure domain-containing protein
MATNVGSISYTLELDTRKFDSSIAAIKGKLDGLKGSLSSTDSATRAVGDSANSSSLGFGKLSLAFAAGQLAAGALTAAIGGIKNAIGESFEALKSLEKSRASFEVLTGSAQKATAVLKDVAGFAAKTPFEFPELAQATKTLLGYGATSENVFSQVKQLGDVTAATGGDLGQLSLIFGQIQAKGKLTGEEFRQLNQSGAAFGDIIAKELNIPLQDLQSEIEKGNISFDDFQQVLSSATSEGGKFFGGTEKLAQTLDGRISTLKDSFTKLVGSFLGVDFTTGLVDADGLFAQISDTVKQLSADLDKVDLKDIGEKVASAFKFIIDNKGTIAPVLLGIAAGFTAIGVALAFIAINPVVIAIGAVVGALVALEAKFGVFSKLFEIIKPVIDFMATEFKKAWDEAAIAIGQLMVALQPFIDQLKIALAPVIQFIKDNFDQLRPVFQALIAIVTGPLAVMFAPFLLALGVVFAALKLLPPIINAIIGTINLFRDIFLAVSNTVISVATTMGNVFTSVGNTIRSAINTIIAAVQGLAGAISGAISSAINIVRGFVGQFTSAGANLIQGLVNGIRSGISSAISAISSAASAIKDRFTSALGIKSPSTIFAGYGQNILQGLTNGMVDNIRSAVGTISKVAKSVNGSFKDSLDIQLPPIEVQPSKFNIGQTQSSLNDLVSQIQSPTAGLSPVVSSPTTTIQPTTIAGITPQKQVIIAAVPINGIQLTKEQLRDFYRELTTAYGEDLGAIV